VPAPPDAPGRSTTRAAAQRRSRRNIVLGMSTHFDVVVLGAGPGGYVAAIRSAQLGLKTAIIEERYWGGVCLNVGCIPSKALLRNAELAHIFTREAKTFGIQVDGEVRFDYGEAFKRSRTVADGRVKGVHYLMKKNGITEYEGRGSFTDANTIVVNGAGGETQEITFEDEEVSKELAKRYRKLGVDVLTSTRVESIDETGPKLRVTVSKNGEQQVLEADKVLQAIGFAPNVEGYGLEKTGVRLTERGAIDVDGRCRTSVEHIYAIGDVTAKLMLAHAAESMGIVAAETIADAETMELDYVMIPRATYCQPQIASFGWTEAQAREQGFDVKVAKFPFTANGKSHGLGDASGFVKILSDGKYGELLGAHLIGPDVTELLPELTLAQQWDLTVHEAARNVHAHPTLGEAVKEALHGLAGHMINF
jgi:dihydrolipoamide dehydrogenase